MMINYTKRTHCLLDGCRRTCVIQSKDDEWICQKHWSVVPKKYRKLYSMAKRKYKKGQINEWRLFGIWTKCKDQAYKNAWSIH